QHRGSGDDFECGVHGALTYFLVQSGSKSPFYIGEYGKAEGYNVIERISRHFANSGTLRRVAINLSAFGVPQPSKFSAYVKQLPDEYRDDAKRKSLEAWIIHIVCHELKIQSKSFCVVKYQAPTHNEQAIAREIINEFVRST
ncbi:hypothetical protein, partial [Pseudomonas sp. H3(2019)]|uniref:hypothetical protein n=1 Tax=Pseudomonas sp. H3(2019) TaxID=2598724 RepID=UPI0015B4E354